MDESLLSSNPEHNIWKLEIYNEFNLHIDQNAQTENNKTEIKFEKQVILYKYLRESEKHLITK